MKHAGANLDNATALARQVGMSSSRVMLKLLREWRAALSDSETTLLQQFLIGTAQPDVEDLFPILNIFPDLRGFNRCFLTCESVGSVCDAGGKRMYMMFVQLLHREKLNGRTDTP